MTDKIEVYGKEYRIKLENEMLKYENHYLKSIINQSSFHSNAKKTNAYQHIIKIMQILRKPPISWFCRKNSTFVLFEKRYFNVSGEPEFNELLNHRAEGDLIALLRKLNSPPLGYFLNLSSTYKNIVKEYL